MALVSEHKNKDGFVNGTKMTSGDSSKYLVCTEAWNSIEEGVQRSAAGDISFNG